MTTYRVLLRNGQLDWGSEGVPPSLLHVTVPVEISILPTMSKQERGKVMAAALERIAESGGAQSFGDPVAWQREIREDRDLDGRTP